MDTITAAEISAIDAPYETQLLSSPSLTNWLAYYNHCEDLQRRIEVLRRATYTLERSYKIWVLYLDHICDLASTLCPIDFVDEYNKVIEEFERCLGSLSKFPLVWVKYLKFIILTPNVTRIRRTFDRSLRSLPITQHHWIWPLFTSFGDSIGGKTGSAVYQRWHTFSQDDDTLLEKFIEFGDVEKALELLDRASFEQWSSIVKLLSTKNDTMKVERVIRQGLERFPDQQGRLWVALALFFIKLSDTTRADLIFNESLRSVGTIRDFTMCYDSYAQFLETSVTNLMSNGDDEDVLQLQLDRFEQLMDDRELLLTNIKLKQSPHDPLLYLHKSTLFTAIPDIIQCFVDAIQTIPPTTPGMSAIWMKYSELYEQNGDLQTARTLLDKAIKWLDDDDSIVDVWIHWAELEIRQDDLTMALKVMEIATDPKSNKRKSVTRQGKLWSFYLDLVESTGDVKKTCEIYDKVLSLKLATPLIIINYANFLEELNRFEQSFTVYERGIAAFPPATSIEIWNIYLIKAMKRVSVERMRELFDECLEQSPKVKWIYVTYAKYEEDHGSVNRGKKILNQGVQLVEIADKVELFEMLIQLSSDHFGAASTRPYYTQAIESLPPSSSLQFIIRFSKMEESLHEYARVRSLLQHGAFLQSVQKGDSLWSYWKEFELKNGDKDSYKDMLKCKRQVDELFGLNDEVEGFINDGNAKKVDEPQVESLQVENPDAIDLDI